MADLIDNPAINSPFEEPQRHFRIVPERLTLRFLTPLRLTHEERLVSQDRYAFPCCFPVCGGGFPC